MVRHVIFCSEPVELPADLTILEITAGKIDGNGQIDIGPELKVLIKTADFFGNIKIQFGDQLCSLKRFDEDRGQQMAILGVIPTSKASAAQALQVKVRIMGWKKTLISWFFRASSKWVTT